MRKLFFLISFFVLGILNVVGQQDSSIDAANQAYLSYNYSKALSGYNLFWESKNGTVQNRVLAAQRLAYLSWRVENRIEDARDWIGKAVALKVDKSGSHTALSLYEMEAGNFDKAIDQAREAIASASSDLEVRNAEIQFCKTVLQNAISNVESGKNYDYLPLKEAASKVRDVSKAFPEDLTAAKLSIGISIINRNLEDLLASWKRYYGVEEPRDLGTVLSKPYETIQKIVSKNKQIKELNKEDGLKLVLALVRSRLFSYINVSKQLFVKYKGIKNEELENAIVYSGYLKEMEDVTYRFYKKTATGNANTQDFINELRTTEEKCWNQLILPSKPQYTIQLFRKTTSEMFGNYPTQGIVNGHYSFYIGHIIFDENQSVSQHGQEGQLRLITLDNVFANDYSGWFTSTQRVSGTAGNRLMVTYRQAIGQDAVTFWNMLNDSTRRAMVERRIERLRLRDREMAAKDPYAILSGLRLTILYSDISSVFDSLKSMDLDDHQIRSRFISYHHNLMETSVLHHEARHSIDYRLGKFSSNEMEYRAKLSGIVFSSKPLVILAASTLRKEAARASHGIANGRLVEDFVKWMVEHESEIKMFEEGVPHILQLDKLSNKQVIDMVSSLEPLLQDND